MNFIENICNQIKELDFKIDTSLTNKRVKQHYQLIDAEVASVSQELFSVLAAAKTKLTTDKLESDYFVCKNSDNKISYQLYMQEHDYDRKKMLERFIIEYFKTLTDCKISIQTDKQELSFYGTSAMHLVISKSAEPLIIDEDFPVIKHFLENSTHLTEHGNTTHLKPKVFESFLSDKDEDLALFISQKCSYCEKQSAQDEMKENISVFANLSTHLNPYDQKRGSVTKKALNDS